MNFIQKTEIVGLFVISGGFETIELDPLTPGRSIHSTVELKPGVPMHLRVGNCPTPWRLSIKQLTSRYSSVDRTMGDSHWDSGTAKSAAFVKTTLQLKLWSEDKKGVYAHSQDSP
jgi:hypothetical protein